MTVSVTRRAVLTAMALALVPVISPAVASGALGQEIPVVAFDVASIKPVPSGDQGRDGVRLAGRRAEMIVTPSRMSISNMSLQDILRRAFRIESYQMSGPQWLSELRFDIQATIPGSLAHDQVPVMLQNLLVERFGLVVHRESREISGYALVRTGSGRMPFDATAAAGEADAITPSVPSAPAASSETGTRTLDGVASAGPATFRMTMKVGNTVIAASMARSGLVQVDMSRVSMTDLARVLAAFTGRPVSDRTGLPGTYRVALELAIEDLTRLAAVNQGVTLPFSPSMPDLSAAPAGIASEPSGDGSITLTDSLEKSGLRLDSRTLPVDVLVVDTIARTPTEN